MHITISWFGVMLFTVPSLLFAQPEPAFFKSQAVYSEETHFSALEKEKIAAFLKELKTKETATETMYLNKRPVKIVPEKFRYYVSYTSREAKKTVGFKQANSFSRPFK